jgi:TorA maturation chaperone TorD
MRREQSSSEAARRARAYAFLASLYAWAPDAGLLARMAAIARVSNPAALDPVAASLAFLPVQDDAEGLAEALAVEHARLFGGIQKDYGLAPPYESLWRGGPGAGDGAVALALAYREASYEPAGDGLPPDHLAEELRFMAALCHGEAEFAATGLGDDAGWARARQAAFLRKHLLAWVPTYCTAVAEAAHEPFFRALAEATADAIEEDACRLAEAPAV